MLVFAAGLAGCAEAVDDSQEIVLESAAPDEVQEAESGGEAPTRQTPHAGERGHLTGFVVDDSLRPVEGARVALPGLDLGDTTQADGAFSFPDLWPGPYRLTAEAAGHDPANTVVEVVADEFVQVKFVLQRVAPPTPYHETQTFAGFADVVLPYTLMWWSPTCPSCTFRFDVEPEGLQTLVVEVVRDMTPGGFYVGADADYFVRVYSEETARVIGDCWCYNPAYMRFDAEALEEDSVMGLFVRPYARPVPEFNVEFQVYVTAFYHEPAPDEWSFLGDS